MATRPERMEAISEARRCCKPIPDEDVSCSQIRAEWYYYGSWDQPLVTSSWAGQCDLERRPGIVWNQSSPEIQRGLVLYETVSAVGEGAREGSAWSVEVAMTVPRRWLASQTVTAGSTRRPMCSMSAKP